MITDAPARRRPGAAGGRTSLLRRPAVLAAVLALVTATVLPTAATSAAEGASANPVTAARTITRSNLDANGNATVVESRNFSVTVGQTQDLKNRESIDVSWSGAHPTGAIQLDPNGTGASNQEYPVVILQCRGVDPGATGSPGTGTASPQTCWTHGTDPRYNEISYTDFAPWRLDRFAPAAERAAQVNRPAQLPPACSSTPARNERWLPLLAANGTAFNYGNAGCAGLPPEDFLQDSTSSSVPPNATFAASTVQGTGSVKFDVWTDQQNSSLGCSAVVACTLEIIPILGLSCDPFGKSPDSAPLPASDIPTPGPDETKAAGLCQAGAANPPGDSGNQPPNLAVSGQLWWSASNWRNRVPVPLTFAPVSHACDLLGSGAPVQVYGSELMTQATDQWAPAFCQDPKLFRLTHVQTAEPLAKSLVSTGSVQAAFASRPPPSGFSRPVVQAPVGVTGFAISYTVDDASGHPVNTLRLNARLLAKLLTESYPELDFDLYRSGQFPYLGRNPVNVTMDPEFIALNPGIERSLVAGTALSAGASTLIMLEGNSDVTAAVTAYINADPEARAWLDGAPDPWGMIVNQSYKSIALPVTQWPLLDPTVPDFGGQSPCETYNPSPWLPTVASPTPSLALAAIAVQFASPPAKVSCTNVDPIGLPAFGWEYVPSGRQEPGLRFTIGVTTLAQARRYNLNTAELQTQTTLDRTVPFRDAANRIFASPTDDALRAAAAQLVAEPSTGTWTLPNASLSSNPRAYPGTMLVNADIPTTGLPANLASDYAKLLRFAAGPGQVSGTGNGQLPPGYLPMTAANGLGSQVGYTLRAADDVQAQTGRVTALTPGGTPPSATPSTPLSAPAPPLSAGTAAPPAAAAGTSSGGRGAGGGAIAPGAPARGTGGQASGTPLAAAPRSRLRTVGVTVPAAGLTLPLLLGIAALGALVAGASWVPPLRSRRRP